jgi:hypothetical protein
MIMSGPEARGPGRHEKRPVEGPGVSYLVVGRGLRRFLLLLRLGRGPESWPLAAVSRSTNSITAIGAASPKRKPAHVRMAAVADRD